jgi:hypothetical protein
VCGLVVVAEFMFRSAAVTRVNDELIDWMLIVSAASFLMGGVSVFLVNLRKARPPAPGWPYAAVLVISLVGVAFLGILGGVGEGTLFDWLFQNMQVPMQSTMFALLAFYISSAAYRAFRMRSAQATVLLVAAAVVMLGNVPLGRVISPHIPAFSAWILGGISLAAQRGLIIGVALGAVATALRVLAGIERSYIGAPE